MSEPLVGVVMGSTSDWETMRHATETLQRFGISHDSRVVSAPPHAEASARIRRIRRRAGAAGDHCRRGRGGASAGHARRRHDRAGDRRARAIQGTQWPRLAAEHRADAGRHPRRNRRHRTPPARRTPHCSPSPSLPAPTRRCPGSSSPSAKSKPPKSSLLRWGRTGHGRSQTIKDKDSQRRRNGVADWPLRSMFICVSPWLIFLL